MRTCLIIAATWCVAGCSLVTVEQDPFPPLKIQAERPAPPPPRIVLTESHIQITDRVQFEYNSATLKEISYSLLDEVVQILTMEPQIKKVQIEGYTDSTGDEGHNRRLSKQRADSVRDYIVDQGIEKSRLTTKGLGPDSPVADNGTKEGRAENRRVEFKILEQGPKETLVHDED
jgi:outer membrane protein OmpA-like peptidoglycan-associated protein